MLHILSDVLYSNIATDTILSMPQSARTRWNRLYEYRGINAVSASFVLRLYYKDESYEIFERTVGKKKPRWANGLFFDKPVHHTATCLSWWWRPDDDTPDVETERSDPIWRSHYYLFLNYRLIDKLYIYMKIEYNDKNFWKKKMYLTVRGRFDINCVLRRRNS